MHCYQNYTSCYYLYPCKVVKSVCKTSNLLNILILSSSTFACIKIIFQSPSAVAVTVVEETFFRELKLFYASTKKQQQIQTTVFYFCSGRLRRTCHNGGEKFLQIRYGQNCITCCRHSAALQHTAACKLRFLYQIKHQLSTHGRRQRITGAIIENKTLNRTNWIQDS